jgi:hypothetical protein
MNKYVVMCILLFLFFPLVYADDFMGGPAVVWFLLFFIFFSIISLPGLFFGLFFTIKELLVGGIVVFILNIGIIFGISESFYGTTVGYPTVFLMILTLIFDSIIGSILGDGIDRIKNRRINTRVEKERTYLFSTIGLFIIALFLLKIFGSKL